VDTSGEMGVAIAVGVSTSTEWYTESAQTNLASPLTTIREFHTERNWSSLLLNDSRNSPVTLVMIPNKNFIPCFQLLIPGSDVMLFLLTQLSILHTFCSMWLQQIQLRSLLLA
jgi:hypothetical protein